MGLQWHLFHEAFVRLGEGYACQTLGTVPATGAKLMSANISFNSCSSIRDEVLLLSVLQIKISASGRFNNYYPADCSRKAVEPKFPSFEACDLLAVEPKSRLVLGELRRMSPKLRVLEQGARQGGPLPK